MQQNKKIIVVLGMHRCGTSMVTRVFSELGAGLGNNLMPPAKDNPAGFWEPVDIVNVHDELLDYLDSSWDDPRPLPDKWWEGEGVEDYKNRLQQIAKEQYSTINLPIMKDPRVCRLLPLWKIIFKQLGWQPYYILVARSPLEVAKSLFKRNTLELDQGYLLWLRHIVEAEKYSRGSDRVFLLYENMINDPESVLKNCLPILGIDELGFSDSGIVNIEGFIDSKLRHNFSTESELDTTPELQFYVADIFKLFRDVANNAIPETGLQKVFDQASKSLIATDALYSSINVLTLNRFITNLADNESSIKSLKVALDDNNAEINRLNQVVAKCEQNKSDLEQQVVELNRYINILTNSNSWRITLPLREIGVWIREPASQVHRYMWHAIRISKVVYMKLPFNQEQRTGHKVFLAKYASWLLRTIGGQPVALVKKKIDLIPEDQTPAAESITVLTSEQPLVSIIIPVYGKLDFTLRCIASIAKFQPAVPYEVIVVDDCSPDNSLSELQRIKGIDVLENTINQGFIRSCNAGAKKSKGKYLCFLNNDTQITANWLDELCRTFDEVPEAGLVGSKLVYPDGSLQEAGGIVWSDGSAWNYGRNDDPAKPQYNYMRDIDYCSGASIMIPNDLFFRVGCFDEMYVPAYYEDADMAFKLRDAGYRTIYQPLSTVIHFEGVSSGTDLKAGVKQYQIDNAKKFFSKWKHVLAWHKENGLLPELEKERNITKRILVVDACTPAPDKDAGSVLIQSYLRIIQSLGYKVTFIPADNFMFIEGYTSDLQRTGIECLYAPYNRDVIAHLKERGGEYDVVMLYRANFAIQFIDAVKKYCGRALTIFNTVDLHYLRMQRQAEIEKSERLRKEAEECKKTELRLIDLADKTIILSEAELQLLKEEDVDINKLHVIPLIQEIPGLRNSFEQRKDIVFVGGFQHQPNADAVHYFCKEIWPPIHARLEGVKFYIIGSHMPKDIKEIDIPGVFPIGFVDEVSEYFDRCRISVAPLRFGAGLKGKVSTSLSYGLPCVGTPIAVEGSGLINGEHVLVANSPEAFSDAVCRLYQEPLLWKSVSDNGLEFANNEYSLAAGKAKIEKVLQ